MKKLFFILFIILPFQSFSQNAEPASFISIGLNFSPDYSFRTLKLKNTDIYEYYRYFESRNRSEKPKLGYTTGLNINFHLSKRFSVGTGLFFSDKGERIEAENILISSSSTPDPTLANLNVNRHYYYLEVPVKLDFYLLTGKTKLYISGGLAGNFFLVQRSVAKIDYLDGRSEKHSGSQREGFATINPSFIGGMGVSYDINQKLILRMEPTYRRSIKSIISENNRYNRYISTHLYSAGLNIGLNYKL